MSYRCVKPFWYLDRVYPGGVVVDDHDPILDTHEQYFAKVEGTGAATTETASAAPGEMRTVLPPPRKPRKRKAKPGV